MKTNVTSIYFQLILIFKQYENANIANSVSFEKKLYYVCRCRTPSLFETWLAGLNFWIRCCSKST